MYKIKFFKREWWFFFLKNKSKVLPELYIRLFMSSTRLQLFINLSNFWASLFLILSSHNLKSLNWITSASFISISKIRLSIFSKKNEKFLCSGLKIMFRVTSFLPCENWNCYTLESLETFCMLYFKLYRFVNETTNFTTFFY